MPLAAGGMARIYIGRSTGIGSFERHVVLKLITPERANDHTAVQMFLDEARLAASLNHQNVAQVFEVGEDSSIHYLAMEYVHGQDLRALLAKAGSQGTRIPLELALTVVTGAAAGLNHAHERRSADGTPMGIVHRDVSPSNIMIGYDGAVKLLDFGIAKATARSVETQSGIIKGKFAYMAPEQCRGRDVDRRSDVFSLGIILYEISTQHRCFRADSDFDTMHRIVTGDVVRPTRLVQGYPQALEAIVMKALAVDAAQRYQSAGLLLEAIEAFAVSARMSLSTMGLGRFMRDMFGEVLEPWVGPPQKQPMVAKENTISSTDGRSDVVPTPRLPSEEEVALQGGGVPDDESRFPDSGGVNASKTILDLPRRPGEQADDQPGVEWNAKSYPSTPPSMASDETLPPDATVRPTHPPRKTPPRGISQQHPAQPGVLASPPQGSGPLAQSAFAQSGSGSGPAIAPPVSTRHGYASGGANTGTSPSPNELSYPRYQSQPGDDVDMQIRPSRRALFIGLAILLAGVIALVVHLAGGSKDKDEAIVPVTDTAGSADTGSAKVEPAVKPDVVDETVSIHIVSDPKGADVIIDGTKRGTTPFDGKLKRGTTINSLVIHLDGYTDFTSKIDLAGEYSNDKIKLVKIPDKKPPEGAGSAEPSNAGSGETTGDKPGEGSGEKPVKTHATSTHTTPTHTTHTTPTHTTPTHTGTNANTNTNTNTNPNTTGTPPTPPTPPKAKCQPQGQVNPFDTSCDGKACPPCK